MHNLGYIISATALLLVAISDARNRTIPNFFIVVLLAMGLIYAINASNWPDLLYGGLVGFITGLILFSVKREVVGAGDAKLMAVVGLLLGATGFIFILAVSVVLGIAWAIYRKNQSIPYGVFLGTTGAGFLYTKLLTNF